MLPGIRYEACFAEKGVKGLMDNGVVSALSQREVRTRLGSLRTPEEEGMEGANVSLVLVRPAPSLLKQIDSLRSSGGGFTVEIV